MQPDTVQEAMRYSKGILPAATLVIGNFVFSRFSLNESEDAEVVAQIQTRKSAPKAE